MLLPEFTYLSNYLAVSGTTKMASGNASALSRCVPQFISSQWPTTRLWPETQLWNLTCADEMALSTIYLPEAAFGPSPILLSAPLSSPFVSFQSKVVICNFPEKPSRWRVCDEAWKPRGGICPEQRRNASQSNATAKCPSRVPHSNLIAAKIYHSHFAIWIEFIWKESTENICKGQGCLNCTKTE